METKCDYSGLSIPNNTAYLTVAAKYVGEIATRFGFDDLERGNIEDGIREILGRIIHYSFEPSDTAQVEIACERVPEGLKIVITDQGLPFDPLRPPTELDNQGDSGSISWQDLFSRYMDEVHFRMLGRQGKQTVLIKHSQSRTIEDYFRMCEFGAHAEAPAEESEEGTCLLVRPMEPSESVEVVKAIYEAYGYSYVVEFLYYPERIEEFSRTGFMRSMVVVTEDNRIAAHGALLTGEQWPRIAEMALGVVKPQYRGKGCFNLLSGSLIETARSLGYMGVLSHTVTVHPFSQQAVHKFGLGVCALNLGYIPMFQSYKGIRETLRQRVSVTIDFLYLQKPADLVIYPPAHHRDMILKLYRHLGFEPKVRTPESEAMPETSGVVRSRSYSGGGFGMIDVDRIGNDTFREVRRRLKELCLAKIDTIHLYLDLCDPAVFHLTEELEALGFFFAGILPGAGAGDALMLQYLNNVPLDYHEIRLESDMAKELLIYIRDRDPNIIR